MLHPSGGRGTGRASHYHCQHKHLCSCANSNKFEQTACGCHHKVLAKELFNPHPSHAWHEGMPSFNPGGRKDVVYKGYGGPTSFLFECSNKCHTWKGRASAIYLYAVKVQNAIHVVWLFARLKNKRPRRQCIKCKCIY